MANFINDHLGFCISILFTWISLFVSIVYMCGFKPKKIARTLPIMLLIILILFVLYYFIWTIFID